ncbi:MAG: M15 family metallopeptidase [Clostridiales bacterium]|nr:M15 family metallopeptidase [Clostridiales bacterium]
MSDRRRRRENIITALLIAGMCIVIGATIIVVIKLTRNEDEVMQLTAGMTEATGFSLENTTESTGAPASLPSIASPDVSSAASVTNTPTPEPTLSPTPTDEPTPTPSPVPEKLTSIKGYSAGTVISSDKIDRDNLSQYFTSQTIVEGDSVYDRIYGKSYVDNDNIGLDDLRYLKMLHVNFDGDYQVGEMIVNADVASEVLEIFEMLCSEGYEINSMHLIDDYWAGDPDDSDWYSIDANNTSCFCYRTATGSGNLSKHALGKAIDINPQQNPYVTYDSDGVAHYSHDNASSYVYGRSSDTEHVITTSDRAYDLFTDYGWTWGGSWSSPKDYQHFQLS